MEVVRVSTRPVVQTMVLASAIALVTLLSSCDGSPDPQPPPISAAPALSPDALAVKSVRDEIGNIESTYGVTADAMAEFFNQVERGEITPDNRDAANATFVSNMRMGKTILAQSQNIEVPTITDRIIRGYIVQVIEAHKAWARDLEKRNSAVFSDHPNIERAEHYKDAAEADASQEAAILALAYRAAGLPFK